MTESARESGGAQPRSGPAWVLLHGTPLTPAVWDHAVTPLTRLTDQPAVIPDCTRVPDRDAQRTLAAAVAEVIGDEPVDVVGHSFGGQVAIDLALLRPRQVRTLVILCSRDTPFPAFAQTAEAVRGGQPPSVEASVARWFTADELATDGAGVREARRELAAASLHDWAAALDAIATYDRSDRVGELTMPVVLVAAGGDAVSTPAAMQEFAARLPVASLEVRSDWMHMSPFADPEALAQLLGAARDQALALG
jgi:pimeloyl-ACP methyl ester carboxylesterase